MKARGLTLNQPSALRDTLVRRGWDIVHAEAAASGLVPYAVVFDGLGEDLIEAVQEQALRAGVDCLTGQDWALLAGSRTALQALGRPDRLPAELWELMERLGRTVGDPDRVEWRVRDCTIDLTTPCVFGIINVTPDSFSDGGRFLEPEGAIAQAGRLAEGGADGLDLGAESTRPGTREPLPVDQEWGRLRPVLVAVRERFPDLLISVDTAKSEIARRALDAGANVINDVTALRHDRAIADVCAAHGAGLILMHSRGTLGGLASEDHATYDDPATDVTAELEDSVGAARAAGVAESALVVDPGLGFQKRTAHNWEVLRHLHVVESLGYPVMVGPSRKRFIGAATGAPVAARDDATAAVCALAWHAGARLFRVHDVAKTREALAVATTWEGT